MKKTFLKIIPYSLPVLIIVLWQVSSMVGILRDNVLPSPLQVIQQAITLWNNGRLPRNIAVSLYRATAGLLLGGSIGFIFGLANGLSKVSRSVFDSSIQMIRNIPHLALVPLFILWFGIGEPAKILLVSLGVMFPIYINTYSGIKDVDPELIEMGRVYQFSKWQMFKDIIVPAALPNILVGLRFALGVMWTTLIVSEQINARSGLGYMAMDAQQFANTRTIILVVIIYALLGKLSDSIAKFLEDELLSWRERRVAA
ncbi:ABC transporter permease subunit [Oenococcus kitaharae]|uniref:Alkanesulfonates transport system permease protein n=1 Tax=Oenococcus kitaharae DSM 17330 TaxID=1045004 RepID=G9WFN3_9LACO|nr:ABC transporter permease subunit [Oenococcus kitaharae]EHN59325.1 Alkanesulfonates transport system permease protein [Oenococcus kitaharae DSM 17330]MCV3296003.1 ABC transporter permease subunit [Oenococcus kitaharae]OEY82158.1 ABC transporter permease [Oenococcus kitaharae]OEY82581.1 ABC transporter permease [Oenococcus kitaharae]OEY84836.1 ABC transporter permease [Oenococcus kitaharae]